MKKLLQLFGTLCISTAIFCQTTPSPLLQSFQAYQTLKAETTFHPEWQLLGPVTNSARVEAVQAHPSRPGTLYAAFGSGNLWKTTNNGLSWKPIFENQAALGIGDIALAPSNPDVIYVGTGESLKKARNFTMPGVGVYRSDDGGESWQHLGLEDSWHIGEIAVHPTNPDIAFVAVLGHFWSTNENRGLYRTQDGGKNWEHVLYLDENTGANDVVIAPSDPNYVYVSMWEHHPDLSGPKTGIYGSKDGGTTWELLDQGMPAGPKKGRTGVAVSYTNPQKVYALMDNLNLNNRRSAQVYQSLNAGESWRKTHDDDLLIFPGIGWYFTDIYVNPQDDEEIYGLGVRMAHSADGGKTFDLVAGEVTHLNPNIAQTLHLDHCELWIDPINPEHLILGNDGGLYVSYDRGSTWLHHNNIPAGEFYTITLDQEEPYRIFGGTQDDATAYGHARPWNPDFPDPWRYLWIDAWSGGDGCVTQVDPTNPNTIYLSAQNGAAYRKDMEVDTQIYIRPALPKSHLGELAFNFVAPYFISPHSPSRLYHGGNYVFRSEDRGDNWKLISPDLSRSADSTKNSTAAGALAESTMQAGLLYFGGDKGVFWSSKDDGENWEEHSTALPNFYIRSIQPSQHKLGRVYVAMTGINYDQLGAALYRSEDHGANWIPIMNNLPDEPINVIVEDPKFENVLYAGGYRGVYVSTDMGATWSLLGKSLPAVSIGDIKIQEPTSDLVVGTHGRGIYKLNLKPLHEALAQAKPFQTNKLFTPPVMTSPKIRFMYKDVDKASIQAYPISFSLEKAGPVQLSILDGQQIRWSQEIDGKKGFNQFLWDLETSRTESMQPYFYRYRRFLRSGEYTLVLKVETLELKQSLTVSDHP